MTAALQAPGIPDFVRTITTPTPCATNPDQWQTKDPDTIEYARRRCAICPFETACLQWAMDHPDEVGMWGGLTKRQRQVRRGEQITWEEGDNFPTRPQCPCGRFLAADATGPYCYAHPDGVPLLTPILITTLEAALDGARMAVVAERLGISESAVVGRLGMVYRRLGVIDLHPSQRLRTAVAAARAAGVLAGEMAVAS